MDQLDLACRIRLLQQRNQGRTSRQRYGLHVSIVIRMRIRALCFGYSYRSTVALNGTAQTEPGVQGLGHVMEDGSICFSLLQVCRSAGSAQLLLPAFFPWLTHFDHAR